MLSKYSIESALLPMELHQRKNQVIVPRPGTPLASLCSSSVVPSLWCCDTASKLAPGSQEESDCIIDAFGVTNQPSIEGAANPTIHDSVQNTLVLDTVEKIRRHMNFARNVVKPRIMDLAAAVRADMDAVPGSRLVNIEVETYSVTPVISMPAFQRLIDRFCPISYVNATFTRFAGILPVISTDQLLDIIASNFDAGTGAGVRAKLNEWLSIKGNNFIEHVWNKYFLEPYVHLKPADVNVGFRHEELLRSHDNRVDEIAVVFLLAAGLFNNPPKDTNVDLQFFNDAVVALRNNAAMSLANKQRFDSGSNMSTALVREFYPNKIVVNTDVYDCWIKEDGNSPDALLGMMLSKDRFFKSEDITANAGRYIELWDKHSRHDAHSYRMQQFNAFQSSLKKHYQLTLENLSESEKSAMGARQGTIKAAEAIIREVTVKDMDEVFNVCKKLVCRGIFSATDAESIIDSVSTYMTTGDGIDIAEAEAIATVEYIAKWVAKMMRAVPVGSIEDTTNRISYSAGRLFTTGRAYS